MLSSITAEGNANAYDPQTGFSKNVIDEMLKIQR